MDDVSKKTIPQDEIERQKDIMARVKQRIKRLEPLAYVETLGCVQNENDSEYIKGMLLEMGYVLTEEKEEADFILFNTCSVRENAEKTLFGKIGAVKAIKRARPDIVVAVCGCMMQQERAAENIRKKYPYVDLIFGTHSLYRFPELLWSVVENKGMVLDVVASDGCVAEGMPIYREDKTKALVSVMYGCNNFCSYCIVPYVRGRERSRSPEEILKEAHSLVEGGCKEIMLLGQNVNSYGKDLPIAMDFSQLLKKVDEIEGKFRIRFMTSHPKDLSDALIAVMASGKHICRQLHLPFQAGSNRVLNVMNRHYTKEQYLDLVAKVRTAMPDITLTSDVIVGFPGETTAEFEETLEVLEQARFDSIFSFIYSKRPGTPAAQMEDVLSPEEKQANFERLLEVQARISKEKNVALLGTSQTLLVEGISKQDKTMLAGRTDGNKLVYFTGPQTRIGAFAQVKITEAKTWSLTGSLVSI